MLSHPPTGATLFGLMMHALNGLPAITNQQRHGKYCFGKCRKIIKIIAISFMVNQSHFGKVTGQELSNIFYMYIQYM